MAQNKSNLQQLISNILWTDLSWSVGSNELEPVTSGVANFVYTFQLRGQEYYVKFFPQYFKNNGLVAKPEGSFFRESWVYELASRRSNRVVPELVHRSVVAPLLITESWGETSLLKSINTLTVDELLEKLNTILFTAGEFRRFVSRFVNTPEIHGYLGSFSELQRKYLITNSIEKINLNRLEIDHFLNSYASLPSGLVFGDLSLKNILVKGEEVRFCDFESVFIAPPVFDTCYLVADVLSKIDAEKRQDLICKIQRGLPAGHSSDEQKIFFRLLSVCIAYRNSNKLQFKSDCNLDINDIQKIYHM